jgi:hypothetical protein
MNPPAHRPTEKAQLVSLQAAMMKAIIYTRTGSRGQSLPAWRRAEPLFTQFETPSLEMRTKM